MADVSNKKKELLKKASKTAKTSGRVVRKSAERIKDTADYLMDDGQVSASEYAEDQIQHTAGRVLDDTGHAVRKGVRSVHEKEKEKRQERKEDKSSEKEKGEAHSPGLKEKTQETRKQDVHSATVDEPKSSDLHTVANRENVSDASPLIRSTKAESPVHAGERPHRINNTGRTIPSTPGGSVEVARKSAERTIRSTQKATEAARKTMVKAEQTAEKAARAASAAVKAIIEGTQKLVAAIAAGGTTATLLVVVICLVGLITASSFGIFFSGEEDTDGYTLRGAVQEVNGDYQTQLDELRNTSVYDYLEMSGSRASWTDVLSVYSVLTTTDEENPMEVVTMTPEKKEILSDLYWQMTSISPQLVTTIETTTMEVEDEEGNMVEQEVPVEKITLHIEVGHKTAREMADELRFDADQMKQLNELLEMDNSLWMSVLYGVLGADDSIIQVAISQLGNVGGEPYWRWYGFPYRVEWCAIFVSWCAEQCGYIDAGIIPKYAGCLSGVHWFKQRDQWLDGRAEPTPGMIIFFDFNRSDDPLDGTPDHTGIVEKVEDGYVYTIEGNWRDSCHECRYPIGHYEILGYGVPAY